MADEVTTQEQQEPFAVFERGDMGEGVRELQQKLADQGFAVGDVDGIYGGKTQAAALEYQRRAGNLNQTGVFDGATYNALMTREPMTFGNPLSEAAPVTAEAETVEEPTGGLMAKPIDLSNLPLSMGTTTREGRPAVKETQNRLKSLGFYQTRVDGKGGRSTINAIRTFQYYNDLEPTGIADTATRNKLSFTGMSKRRLAKESSNSLLAYLARGEGGGYGAANDYNSKKEKAAWGVRDSYFSDSKGKPLEKLTIKEVQDIQAGGYGNRDVFAVGAYQIVPKTMNEVVKNMGLTGDEVFSPELQDRIALEYLIPKKRPTLGKYLNAEKDISLDDAMMDLAKEWASVPVPRDTKDTKGRPVKKGQSFYVHFGGQRAAHSVTETEEILKEARLSKMMSRG